MLKKSRFRGSSAATGPVALCAALFLIALPVFTGCPTGGGTDPGNQPPVGGGGGGGLGGGGGGPYELTGSKTSAEIQAALDANPAVKLTAVTQSDIGTITIPAGKNVTLDGANAITLNGGGTLLVESAASLKGSGKISLSAGTIVAEASVLNNWTTGTGATKVTIPEPGANIDTGGTAIAAKGDEITISSSATDDTNINNTDAGSTTIYVIGKLKVSDTVSANLNATGDVTLEAAASITGNVTAAGDVTAAGAITGNIKAGGDVTASAAITGSINAGSLTASALITGAVKTTGAVFFNASTNQTALDGLTAASVESAVAITSESAIVVTGELKTTENVLVTLSGTAYLQAGSLDLAGGLTTTGTGTVNITGNAAIAGKIQTGSGSFTIGGEAHIGGAFDAGGNVRFDGSTIVTGVFKPTENINLEGLGAVTLDAAIDTGSYSVKVMNTGGVTLTALNTLAANLAATGVVINGGTGGVEIKAGNPFITVGAGAEITVPDSASIVAGGATNKVEITKAVLKPGTYTADDDDEATLTLGANTEIAVNDGGSVAIPNAGQIVLASDGTSKITLLAGGSLVGDNVASDVIVGSDHTKVKLNAGGFVRVTGTPTFTITTAADAGTTSTDVIVGAIKWVIDDSGQITTAPGADAGSAAAGTLTAGAGTTITIYGST